MNKLDVQELIHHLTDCSLAISRLIDHLDALSADAEPESPRATLDIALDVELAAADAPLNDDAPDSGNITINDNNINTDTTIDTNLNTNINTNIDATIDTNINTTINDSTINNTTDNTIEIAPEGAPDTPPRNNVQASAANPFARLFAGLNPGTSAVPANANPFNLLNMLAGGKGGLPGIGGLPGLGGMGGNLPTTLAQLHDNPQMLNMLGQVANNPGSLNMLSNLTGQSPEALQAALASLQPGAAPAPATLPAAAPAAPAPTLAPIAAQAPITAPIAAPIAAQAPTAHLDSLLAEWHWAPYARVWSR